MLEKIIIFGMDSGFFSYDFLEKKFLVINSFFKVM